MRAPNGPSEIARVARTIIEGMKGKPLDEEIADVMADAIWEAFAQGRSQYAKRKTKRPPPAPGTPGGEETP